MQLLIISILIVFLAGIWRLKFIDGEGAALSGILIVGLALFDRSYEAVAITMVYASVVAMSRYRRSQRKVIYSNIGQADSKKGIYNVIGKVLLPVAAAAFDFQAGFIVVLAYGISDSAGSQIGIFSSVNPMLITTFKRVPTGTNGGVSLLGTTLGAIMGVCFGLGYSVVIGQSLFRGAFFGLVGGLVGNLVDSLYGATIERKLRMSDWSVNLLAGATSLLIAIVIDALLPDM